MSTPMSELPTILNAAIACRDIFRAATKVPRLMQQEWAENRLADFNLWASGAGASAKGKASLDHRLQTNNEAHSIIFNLLSMLRILVEKCIEEAYNNKEDDVSEPSSGVPSRMKNVEDNLNQLSRLTVAIRKAGVRSRLQKADSSFDPDNAQINSLRRHLELLLLIRPDEHGSSESSRKELDTARLTPTQLRLIDANLKRRNRFLYAQRHAQKLEAKPIKQDDTCMLSDAGNRRQRHLYTGKTATLSPQEERILAEDNPPAQSTTTATVVDEQIVIPPKTASPTTVVSVTSSQISYPKPPPIHDDQRVFTCPCCCQSLPTTVARGNHWKKHLMGDILPYTCIFENCSRAGNFYNTKANWLNHMEKEHGGTEQWVCLACSQKSLHVTFREPTGFTAHLEQEHSKIKPQQILMLLSAWRRKIPLKISACPLCRFVDDDQNSVLDHVAEHIHSFSLRSLPWAPRENSEDNDEEEEEGYSSYFKQNPYFEIDSSRSQHSSSVSERSSLATDIRSFEGVDNTAADSPGDQQNEITEDSLNQISREVLVQADTGDWLGKLSNEPRDPNLPARSSRHLKYRAPSFYDTEVLRQITTGHVEIQPQIIAIIARGFFELEEKWKCYRFEAFAVCCQFTLHPYDESAIYFVQTAQDRYERIISFAMSISVIVDGSESETWELIHRPPKEPPHEEGRTGLEFQNYKTKPGKVVLQPHQHAASFLDYNTEYPIKTSNNPAQHTFDQIEFQGTVEDGQQSLFNLVVELYAEVSKNEQSQHVKIATSLSEPMRITQENLSHEKKVEHAKNGQFIFI